MQAVRFEANGEPADVLSVVDVDLPEPGPGEVAVRMIAAPINPSDLMFIRGVYGKLPQFPCTPGFEGVGVVERAGGGLLPRMFVGKRVAVMRSPHGSWAERTVLPAKQVIPLPGELSDEQAAMFFINPATAYVLTQKVLRVPPGAWLLQTAATSAVGRMMIRLGKTYGFKTLNVVRRPEAVEELRAAGGDEVVQYDGCAQERENFVERVRSIVGEEGVRFAVDPVGGGTGSAVIETLGLRGHLVVYGTLVPEPLQFSTRKLITPSAKVEGFWLSNYMATLPLYRRLGLVGSIKKLMRQGVLTADVARTFALADVRDAVRAAEEPGRSGKILLTPTAR